MKNVRLFAVAAALGMFASTVVAAEPTKTVAWSDVDSVIKVDLNDKIVVTAPTAKVTLSKETMETGSVYAISSTLNDAQGWLYSNANYWTTPSDAVSTLTLNGARVLAPGAKEIDEDVFVDQINGVTYNSEKELFEALDTKYNFIDVTYEDGDIATVSIPVGSKKYGNHKEEVEDRYYITLTSTGSKRSDDSIIEDVVNYFVNGKNLSEASSYYTATKSTVNTIAAGDGYTVKINDDDKTNNDLSFHFTELGVLDAAKLGANDISAQAAGNIATSGLIVLADQTRKAYFLNSASIDGTATKVNYLFGQSAKKWVKASTQDSVSGTGSAVGKVSLKEGYTINATATFTYDGATDNRWETATDADATTTIADNFVLASGYTPANGDTIVFTAGAPVPGVKLASIVAGKDYLFDDTSVVSPKFTTSDVKAYVAVAGVTALSTEYVAATSDAIDAIYFETTTDANRTVKHFVNWQDDDLYYAVQSSGVGNPAWIGTPGVKYYEGQLIKITKANYETLFTNTAVTNGAIYLGNKPVANYGANVTGATKSTYSLIAPKASDGSLVVLTPTALANAEYITVGNGKAYALNVGTDEFFYEAKQVPNDKYNQLTKLGRAGYVTIVDMNDADTQFDGDSLDFAGASVVQRIAIKNFKDYENEQTYSIDIDGFDVTTTVVNTTTEAALGSEDGEGHFNANGIYELKNIPANTSNKYVLVYNNRTGKDAVRNGLDLSGVWAYSSNKEIGTLETPNGEDVECSAVQLEKNGQFYPAFDTEEALNEAIIKVTGLDKALEGTSKQKNSTFYKWYEAADSDADNLTMVGLDGKAVDVKLPEDAKLSTAKVVDSTSADVTVTSNIDSIDTTVAGVKELTYTASYKGEEVGTKTVTVVVAPKYTRTWENGRVKTLVSYYLTGEKYGEFSYNWSGKKVSYTYYNKDGSVSSTGENSLN